MLQIPYLEADSISAVQEIGSVERQPSTFLNLVRSIACQGHRSRYLTLPAEIALELHINSVPRLAYLMLIQQTIDGLMAVGLLSSLAIRKCRNSGSHYDAVNNSIF
jgi:hypothetical protein